MKWFTRSANRLTVYGFIILTFAGSLTLLHAQAVDWTGVENIFGRKGTVQEGVIKIAFPRSDLRVNVGNVVIDPALALTSWLAFSSMGDRTMVMGDLVLLASEIGPVEKSLLANGLKI